MAKWICDECYKKIGKEVECYSTLPLDRPCEICSTGKGTIHIVSDKYGDRVRLYNEIENAKKYSANEIPLTLTSYLNLLYFLGELSKFEKGTK